MRLLRPFVAGIFGIAVVARNVAASPQPLVKDGSCPSGYSASGNYCVPDKKARFALPKSGACPSGYFASGNYCVAQSDESGLAIPRSGSCPNGYFASGDYCVSNK